jgi:hypothetical protein
MQLIFRRPTCLHPLGKTIGDSAISASRYGGTELLQTVSVRRAVRIMEPVVGTFVWLLIRYPCLVAYPKSQSVSPRTLRSNNTGLPRARARALSERQWSQASTYLQLQIVHSAATQGSTDHRLLAKRTARPRLQTETTNRHRQEFANCFCGSYCDLHPTP